MSPVENAFPTDIKLKYIPYNKENADIISCSRPLDYDLAKKLPGKKVVLTAAPGAFTPACTEQHIPGYISDVEKYKAKGIDQIIVLTANDPFVNAAWGKALGYTNEENYIIFATDPNVALSKELGDSYVVDLSKIGFGVRTNRYSAIIEDGKVKYLENEEEGGFSDITRSAALLQRL